MRIASITAGAAGMFCGSCMRDNTLAAALRALGHDALLVPTYTPIRTDEPDLSQPRVFFGGINVFLQQKSWLFRHTPRFLDRLLDNASLLRWVSSRFASWTSYSQLGALTVSMLKGTDGRQRKELDELVTWLETEIKPDVILLTNVLLSGIVPELKRRLKVPIVATLQGDDIFLDALPPKDLDACRELIAANCRDVDGFLVTSRFYADHMAGYLGLDRDKMHVVYPGISLKGHAVLEHLVPLKPPYRIGYFARICPEKGFHNLIDAFIKLKDTRGAPACKLVASGWLGDGQKNFLDDQMRRLTANGLRNDFEYVATPDHTAKARFLNSLDVFTVPTTYHEPKGLYVLEAWANGVPVVQPAHGAFPELIGATGGGLLVEPNDPAALAAGLLQLLKDPGLRDDLGRKGQAGVRERFTAERMAQDTVAVLEELVPTTA